MEKPREERRFTLMSRVLLGLCGAAALVGLIVIVETMGTESRTDYRLLATAIPSAICWWCVMRLPSFTHDDHTPRPFLRRLKGSHYRSSVSGAQWRDAESSPASWTFAMDRLYSLRRTSTAIAFVAYATGAWLAALAAGSEDRFGDLTDAGLIGFMTFGGLCAAAMRAALRLVLAHRAARVDHDRVVLGYAVGYFPPLTLHRSGLVGILVQAGEAAFLSKGRRVDRVDLLRFDDPRGLLESLGVSEGLEELDSEVAGLESTDMTAEAPQLALDVSPRAKSSPGRPLPQMHTGPVDTVAPWDQSEPPSEDDRTGAVRQWRLRLALVTTFLVIATVGSLVSANWWISQRQQTIDWRTKGSSSLPKSWSQFWRELVAHRSVRD